MARSAKRAEADGAAERVVAAARALTAAPGGRPGPAARAEFAAAVAALDAASLDAAVEGMRALVLEHRAAKPDQRQHARRGGVLRHCFTAVTSLKNRAPA